MKPLDRSANLIVNENHEDAEEDGVHTSPSSNGNSSSFDDLVQQQLIPNQNPERMRSNTADAKLVSTSKSNEQEMQQAQKQKNYNGQQQQQQPLEEAQTLGLWQAYLDQETKRIFWIDQATGEVSWYVSSLNPKVLPTRSYVASQVEYNAKNTPATRHSTTDYSSSLLSNLEQEEGNTIEGTVNNRTDSRDNSRKRRSKTDESISSTTSSIPSTTHSEPGSSSTSSSGSSSSITRISQKLSQRVRSPSKLRKENPLIPSLASSVSSPSLLSKMPMKSTQNDNQSSLLLPSSSTQPNSDQLKNLLIAGAEMNKHRSRGASRRRFIIFSSNLDRIMWSKSRRLYLQGNVLGKILIQDMVEVRVGFDRQCFRANFNKPNQDKCCFLLQATHRTLNLETDNSKECEEWVTALRYVISSYRLKSQNGNGGNGDGMEYKRRGFGSGYNDSSGNKGTSNSNNSKHLRNASRAGEGLRSDSAGSTGVGIMRTMTSWMMRGSKQNTSSNSDGSQSRYARDSPATSDANSEISSSPPGVISKNDRKNVDRQRTVTLADTADIGSRGQLMAMEERQDEIKAELNDLKQRMYILSQACGICCDMMWESGARDDGGKEFKTDSEVIYQSWQGSQSMCGGPLKGKPPKDLKETNHLADVMIRMSRNLVQGRGGGEEEVGEEEVDNVDIENNIVGKDENNTKDSTNEKTRPRARSTRASTFGLADVYENLRKALILKLDRAIDMNILKRKIDEQSETIERMEEQILQYDILNMYVGKQQQRTRENTITTHHNTYGGNSSSGRMSSMVAGNIDGWLNTLTPDLNVSWTLKEDFNQSNDEKRIRTATGIPPGILSDLKERGEFTTIAERTDSKKSEAEKDDKTNRGSLLYDFLEGVEIEDTLDNSSSNNKDEDNAAGGMNQSVEKNASTFVTTRPGFERMKTVDDMAEVNSEDETDQEHESNLSVGTEPRDSLLTAATLNEKDEGLIQTNKEDALKAEEKTPLPRKKSSPPPPPKRKKIRTTKNKKPPPPPPPPIARKKK